MKFMILDYIFISIVPNKQLKPQTKQNIVLNFIYK